MAKKKATKAKSVRRASPSSQGFFGKHKKLDLLLVLLVGVVVVVYLAKLYNDQVNDALNVYYTQPMSVPANTVLSPSPTANPY